MSVKKSTRIFFAGASVYMAFIVDTMKSRGFVSFNVIECLPYLVEVTWA